MVAGRDPEMLLRLTDAQIVGFYCQPLGDEEDATPRSTKQQPQSLDDERRWWRQVQSGEISNEEFQRLVREKELCRIHDRAAQAAGDPNYKPEYQDPNHPLFKWAIPRPSDEASVVVDGRPIDGDAVLDNLERGGILKKEDVARVKAQRQEWLMKQQGASDATTETAG